MTTGVPASPDVGHGPRFADCDNFAFVMNVGHLIDAPSYTLAPGHELRRATTDEVRFIRNMMESLGPAPHFKFLDSGEFCVWPKLNTRGYPSPLWLPTERVRRKGYPLAQAHCTPCAQAFGLCVWLTPPPLQAPMAAGDAPGRCTDCVGHTAQNHCRFVSPHRRCPRCFQWGGQSPYQSLDSRRPASPAPPLYGHGPCQIPSDFVVVGLHPTPYSCTW